MATNHSFANLPVVLIAYRCHPAQATSVNASAIATDKLIIAARVLDALGVDYSDADLEKHSLLDGGVNQHIRVTGGPMDRAYLIWAEKWLLEIISTNATSGRYSSRALLRVVGAKWWQLCKKASRRKAIGAVVWLIFARSPLKRAVLEAWYQNLPGIKR